MAPVIVLGVSRVDESSQRIHDTLIEQLLWLIKLRWIAAVGVITVALVAYYIFPVLTDPIPIYICAVLLFLCNIFYYLVGSRRWLSAVLKDVVLGIVQVEVDLVILTAILYFSGGVVNPFSLFYIFHVIIAAIILPRNLSYGTGLTAIFLYGLLTVNELNGGELLGYYPLTLSAVGGLWRNPVYALGIFIAFACTVLLSQYLTRTIVVRMTNKHRELEKTLRDRAEQITTINKMLKITRVEMAHREKMVAVGQMAASIAHEIGNPLASLSSVVQYLCRKLHTHEEMEQLLLIGSQVDRISGILKRMLSLSRPATKEYKWVNINEVIDNTLSLVRFDKRMRDITILNVTDFDLPMVWQNPQLFEQVLLNIVINSMDAMEAKQDKTGCVLEITRKSDDLMVEIRIRDTGVGMSPEVVQRAFESFFTTKEVGKGTGLGLYVCSNLISETNGTIKLESELGKGTTVIINIPIKPSENLIAPDEYPKNFSI